MGTPSPKPSPPNHDSDLAIKTRITSHMNLSHRPSLSLFLRHYCNVPPSNTHPSTTSLETLNLTSLILSSGGKRYFVPLHPPMSSFATSFRSRMKDMHDECLRALDLSDVQITTYLPPQSVMQRVNFLVVVLTFLSFSWRANFIPGSLFYEMVGLGHVPGFAGFCRMIQPWLIWGMVGIHALEAVWMVRTRLRRHGVERGCRVWWMWVGTCFIEGAFSFSRMDGMVREGEREMEEKEKERH